MIMVSIFSVMLENVVSPHEAPDFKGLHKNKNRMFPLI